MEHYKSLTDIIKSIDNLVETMPSIDFDGLIASRNAIAALPDADIKTSVHGEWVPVSDDPRDRGIYRCSNCGCEHCFPELALGGEADNFCSDCGADMRG